MHRLIISNELIYLCYKSRDYVCVPSLCRVQ